MTKVALKKQIIKKLDAIDNEALLQAIYTILKEKETENSYTLTPVHKKQLDKQWKEYKNGKTKAYTAKEVTNGLYKRLKKKDA